MGWRDELPCDAHGKLYSEHDLLELVRQGKSPFEPTWDVKLLIQEVEEALKTEVTDTLSLQMGSNNYGFHFKVASGLDVVARLARGDVNMPDFDGPPIDRQEKELLFEIAVCDLLSRQDAIRVSKLLYHRVPVQLPGLRLGFPATLSGRRLLVFQKAQGENNVWKSLNDGQKLSLLNQLAHMRVALFLYNVPLDFATRHLHDRTFNFKPESLGITVAPTRTFCKHMIESKIKATIGHEGDMIGWEGDGETVGPRALAAKESLLRAIPHMLPPETSDDKLYRFVLEHGDFGIHNTSISVDDKGNPTVTSLYDWETGCIVPALLSDPLVAVSPVDLIVDDQGRPFVARVPRNAPSTDLEVYTGWATHYFQQLYKDAPEYELAIEAGQDVRHLWFALRDWHGGDSEQFFDDLGEWAEERIRLLNRSKR